MSGQTVREEYLDVVDHDWILNTVLEDCKKVYNGNDKTVRMHCYREDHEDNNASAYYNSSTGFYYCFGCGHKVDYINLIMERLGVSFKDAMKIIRGGETYNHSNKENKKEYSTDDILKWNADLLNSKAKIKMVEDYGIPQNIIIRYKLGLTYDNRLIIPSTMDGKIVSIKHHSIVPVNDCKSYFAYGKTFLYPMKAIKTNKKLLFVEGEPDCLALYGAGVDRFASPCCATGGAMRFSKMWAEYFKGKIVYASLDNDEAGEKGMSKFVNAIAEVAEKLYIVKIPCKDMRDFIVKHKAGYDDIVKCLEQAKEYNESHPFYIKSHIYPLIQEALGNNRFTFSALKKEMDEYFSW